MERLTKREGDIVYMVKDGELLAPVQLRGQEVRMVLQRLADFEDARQGEWLNFSGDYSMAECSKCGECYDVSPVEKPKKEYFDLFCQFYNYCPYCGARMDGDSQ